MIDSVEFSDFCKANYDIAKKSADITVLSQIKAHGQFDIHMDLDQVKAVAILNALESAFQTYDPSRDTKLSTFISLIAHNEVLAELGKEATAVKKFAANPKKRKVQQPVGSINAVQIIPGVKGDGKAVGPYEPFETMLTSGSKKEQQLLLAKVMKKMEQLPQIDQVILKCWMYEEYEDKKYLVEGLKPHRTYVQRAIDELGLDDSAANAIAIRCHRAKQKLTALVKGEK